MEADKENTAPTAKGSKNSKRIKRNCSRRQSIKKPKNSITSQEQIPSTVIANIFDQKAPSDLSIAAAVPPICKSVNQEIIVKQESIDNEIKSLQNRKPVETSNDDPPLISVENSQSGDFDTFQQQTELPCNQMESKVQSDSTLVQTNNIDVDGFSLVEIAGDAKAAAITLTIQSSDSFVLEEADEEETTSTQDEASFGSSRNKRESRNIIKISQLMTEEQKVLIETSYRINVRLMNYEVQNKMTMLSKENIKCNICGANYSRLDKCKVHIMSHLEIKPYECIKCNYTTVTVSNIRAHIRKSHLKIKPYVCDNCGKCYGSMILLQEHINSHTGERPFKCETCGIAYMSRQGLNCHYKTHKLNKDVKCDICPKMFKSMARKRAHMLIHNKENMIQCTLCKNYLSNKTSFDAHMKKVHSQKYICDICNKEMLSKKDLYNHKNVHMEAKYKCTLCFKYYKSKHILKEHILKHEGIRKYKCSDCGKTFAQQSHLAAHSATHSDVRFSCEGCEKQFNRRDNMKTHTKRCQLFLHKSDKLASEVAHNNLSNIQL